MTKSGLGEETIILAIGQRSARFDVSPQALIDLKKAGVTDRVLNAMLSAPKAPGLSSPAVAAPGFPSSSAGFTPPAEQPATGLRIPPVEEVGVYYLVDGKWIDLPPEVVNWKSGGVLKSVATVGIVKGDVDRRCANFHSRRNAKHARSAAALSF
jgi:hypothetical protein